MKRIYEMIDKKQHTVSHALSNNLESQIKYAEKLLDEGFVFVYPEKEDENEIHDKVLK